MSLERVRRYTKRDVPAVPAAYYDDSDDSDDSDDEITDDIRQYQSRFPSPSRKEEPIVSRTSRDAPNWWEQESSSSAIGSRTISATSRSSSAANYSRLKLNGGLSLHLSNVRGLAGVANKDTISRDSIPDGEVRTANLIAHLGSKICRTSNMRRAEERRKRPRRAAAPVWDTEAIQVDRQARMDVELQKARIDEIEMNMLEDGEKIRVESREIQKRFQGSADRRRKRVLKAERRREDIDEAVRRNSAFTTNGGGRRALLISKPQSIFEESMRPDGDGIGRGNVENDGLHGDFEGARIPVRRSALPQPRASNLHPSTPFIIPSPVLPNGRPPAYIAHGDLERSYYRSSDSHAEFNEDEYDQANGTTRVIPARSKKRRNDMEE